MQNFISINIFYIRNKSNLSQEDIGNIIGTSYHAVSSYEKKKSLPPVDKIQIFCKEFNLNIDDFVNKDLSKLKKDNFYVEEIKEPYHIIDKKTETMMQNIIDAQTQIIDSKQELVNEKEKRIVSLEKTIERLEVILNQNNKS